MDQSGPPFQYWFGHPKKSPTFTVVAYAKQSEIQAPYCTLFAGELVVGDVEEEAVRLGHSRLIEALGDVPGAEPGAVGSVEVRRDPGSAARASTA